MTIVNPHNSFSPIGYQQFHKKQLFNFQLNRPYSREYANLDDLKYVGNKIHYFDEPGTTGAIISTLQDLILP